MAGLQYLDSLRNAHPELSAVVYHALRSVPEKAMAPAHPQARAIRHARCFSEYIFKRGYFPVIQHMKTRSVPELITSRLGTILLLVTHGVYSYIAQKDGELVDFSYWRCFMGLINPTPYMWTTSFSGILGDVGRDDSRDQGTAVIFDTGPDSSKANPTGK